MESKHEEETKQEGEEKIPFFVKQHTKYLLQLDKSKDIDSIGYYLTEHIRMGGAYWCINALFTL